MVGSDAINRLWQKPHVRQALLSAALAASMMGITVLAVKVFGWQSWARRVATVGPVVREPSQRNARGLSADQRLVAVSPEPVESAPPPKKTAAPVPPKMSASELLAAANQARSRGDTGEAVRLAKVILEFFPNSEPGIQAHLLLGVMYVGLQQPELALPELALFRQVGPPEMKGEALWTQSQALRQLTRSDDERMVLDELIRTFPRSAYVSSARTRLAQLDRDAGAH